MDALTHPEGAPLEIGSEFHFIDLPPGETLPWPRPSVWFALGRDALTAALETQRCTRLWVPDFFCWPVVDAWRRAGIEIYSYEDDPRWTAPTFATIGAAAGDAVLAVNFFGWRDRGAWQQWQSEHSGTVVIEDHSHDPVSRWALSSTADYAFASVRKTFPAPDGAILWSPVGAALPSTPERREVEGSTAKLAAMFWKERYLQGTPPFATSKDVMRDLQLHGEEMLTRSSGLAISAASAALLARGYPVAWRLRREANVRQFNAAVARAEPFRPVVTTWPEGHCPFGGIVAFETRQLRDRTRARLIARGVYPAVHWDAAPSSSARARDLAERILTLTVDQRYGESDVARLCGALLDAARPSS